MASCLQNIDPGHPLGITDSASNQASTAEMPGAANNYDHAQELSEETVVTFFMACVATVVATSLLGTATAIRWLAHKVTARA